VQIPGRESRRDTGHIASGDASRLAAAGTSLLATAEGVDWYETPGSAADLAALSLCRLRRAGAGMGGGPRHGDEAVRRILEEATPEQVVWLASRAVAYMDENGFPEDLERYLGGAPNLP
jgi:hypothetical protein